MLFILRKVDILHIQTGTQNSANEELMIENNKKLIQIRDDTRFNEIR